MRGYCGTCGMPVTAPDTDALRTVAERCGLVHAGNGACADLRCAHDACAVERRADAALLPRPPLSLVEVGAHAGTSARDVLILAASRLVRDGGSPEAIGQYARGAAEVAARLVAGGREV